MSVARVAEGVINLAVGHPHASLLPRQLLAEGCEAAAAVLATSDSKYDLGYADEQGNDNVLESVATFLSRTGGAAPPVLPTELFITCGVSHGLETVLSVLSRPGDVCVVTCPTYFLAARVLADHQLQLREVSCCDTEGLDFAALEALLEREPVRFLYIVTSHANPTGVTLNADARRCLVALAHKHRFWVLADEVYTYLHWGEPLPPRMRAFDEPDGPADCGVIAMNSFSKMLAPALRCGWVEAPSHVVRALSRRGYVVSGGNPAAFVSRLVVGMLEGGGVEAHLAFLQAALKERCELLQECLRAECETGGVDWDWTPPCGGYFLWLRLPEDVDVEVLVAAARTRFAVSVLPGGACSAVSVAGRKARHVRPCFSFLTLETLREGVSRLATAVRAGRNGDGAN
jgi:2-aminoadipate transaminase